MSGALIECIYVACDTQIPAGTKLLDMSVDLGGAFTQDCPPVSFYRLVLREKLWLRKLPVKAGLTWDMQEPVAIFSTDPYESLEEPISRPVRSALAGIVHHAGMWSGGEH